jgi:hypothetical protein
MCRSWLAGTHWSRSPPGAVASSSKKTMKNMMATSKRLCPNVGFGKGTVRICVSARLAIYLEGQFANANTSPSPTPGRPPKCSGMDQIGIRAVVMTVAEASSTTSVSTMV